MPWAAGVYTRGYPSWSNDAAANLAISASKFDIEDNDFAAGLNNTLTRDGLSTPNAAMTWALTSGQVLQVNRGSDGAVFGIGRTGGSTNPSFKFSIADAGGLSIANAGNLNISNSGAVFIYGTTNSNALNIDSTNASGPYLSLTESGTLVGYLGSAKALVTGGAITDMCISPAGSQNLVLGSAGAARMTLNSGGNFVVNSPSSGVAFLINGVSGNIAAQISSATSGSATGTDLYVTRNGSTANVIGQGPSFQLGDISGTNGTLLQNSGGQTELWQNNGSTWNQVIQISTARNVKIQTPGSGPNVIVTGGNAAIPAINFISGGVAGSATATLTANKPGSNQGSATWIGVQINSVLYWIPAWSN